MHDNHIKADIQLDTALLNMYSNCGAPEKALTWWKKILASRNTTPATATFACALRACAHMGPVALCQGKDIHNLAKTCGVQADSGLYEALLEMYIQCGERNSVVTLWTEVTNKTPILSTKLCTLFLGACAEVGSTAHTLGENIHKYIIVKGVTWDEMMQVTLLHMYAKCGNQAEAENIFTALLNQFNKQNLCLSLWNAMMSAYANYGNGTKALDLFRQMISLDITPNTTTFISLLTACSHAGLVDDALHIYESLSKFSILVLRSAVVNIKHHKDISPSLAHQNCIVDALGRSGRISEALMFIEQNHASSIITWTCLLGACRLHHNISIAKYAANKALQINPNEASIYVLLANTYAITGDHKSSLKVYEQMLKVGIKKLPGMTSVFVDNVMHTFFMNNRFHPQQDQIVAKWEELNSKLKDAGIRYVADTSWVTQHKSQEEKIQDLCKHSEKMAICFALISLPPNAPIDLDQNLRLCGDCHTATALISKLENRKITIRDSKRFHVFEGGHCSCKGLY